MLKKFALIISIIELLIITIITIYGLIFDYQLFNTFNFEAFLFYSILIMFLGIVVYFLIKGNLKVQKIFTWIVLIINICLVLFLIGIIIYMRLNPIYMPSPDLENFPAL